MQALWKDRSTRCMTEGKCFLLSLIYLFIYFYFFHAIKSNFLSKLKKILLLCALFNPGLLKRGNIKGSVKGAGKCCSSQDKDAAKILQQ